MNAARMQLDAVLPTASGTNPASAALFALPEGETFSQVLASECDPGVGSDLGSQCCDAIKGPTSRDGVGEARPATQGGRILHPRLTEILDDAVPLQIEVPLVSCEVPSAKRTQTPQGRGTSMVSTPSRRSSVAEGMEPSPLGFAAKSAPPSVAGSSSLLESIPATRVTEPIEDAEESRGVTASREEDSQVLQPIVGMPLPVVNLTDANLPKSDSDGTSDGVSSTQDFDAAGDRLSVQRPIFNGSTVPPIATPSDQAPVETFPPGPTDLGKSRILTSLPDSGGPSAPGNPPHVNPPHVNPPHVNPPHVNPPHVNPAHVNPAHVNPPHVNPAHVEEPLRDGVARKGLPTSGERSAWTAAPVDSHGALLSGSGLGPQPSDGSRSEHLDAAPGSRGQAEFSEVRSPVTDTVKLGDGRTARPTGRGVEPVPSITVADTLLEAAAGFEDPLRTRSGRISIGLSAPGNASVNFDVTGLEAAVRQGIQMSEGSRASNALPRTGLPPSLERMPHVAAGEPVSGMPGTSSRSEVGTESRALRKSVETGFPGQVQVQRDSGGTPPPGSRVGDSSDSIPGSSGGQESRSEHAAGFSKDIGESGSRDRKPTMAGSAKPLMPEIHGEPRPRWSSVVATSQTVAPVQETTRRPVSTRTEHREPVGGPMTPTPERRSPLESISGDSLETEGQEISPSRVAAALSARGPVRSQNGRPGHRLQSVPARMELEPSSRPAAGSPGEKHFESGLGSPMTAVADGSPASFQPSFTAGRRDPGSQDPSGSGAAAFAIRPETTEFHSELQSMDPEPPAPRPSGTLETHRPTSHQVELETVGQGRLQLRMTETGSELRIEARQLGNALSGTEGGWQDLQSRLGESGVVLGPLQSSDSQPDFRRDQTPSEPRHAVCYDGSQTGSDRQRDPSGFQTRGGVTPFLNPLPESVSDPIAEGPPARRRQGREWWA
jgi:hypothetical protein